MSCQCHTIGGPFIAEDPNCVIHGWARGDRERQASELLERSEREDISIEELRNIVQQLCAVIEEIY